MHDLPLAPWKDEQAQNIAEYALIVAVIVLLVVGTVRYFWSAINHMGQ
jgi:Flp pilus assembly pilin Flp